MAVLLSPTAFAQGADAALAARDWPLYGRTFNEERYSPLERIDKSNVSQLGLAFSFKDFVVRGRTHRGNSATPVVVDGVMYFSGPWSVLFATLLAARRVAIRTCGTCRPRLTSYSKPSF